MRLDIPIRKKLVIYYLLIGLSSIVLVGIYSFQIAKKAIIDRSFDQLTTVRETKKRHLTDFFDDRLADAALLSGWLADAEEGSRPIMYLSNNQHVLDFLESRACYRSLLILPARPDSIRSLISFDLKDRQFDTIYDPLLISRLKSVSDSSRGGLHLTDYMQVRGRNLLWVSSPIPDNRFKGARLFIGIPIEAINRLAFEKDATTGMGVTGETYLVGKDRLMRTCSRFMDNSVLMQKVETPSVDSAFLYGEGFKIIRDYRNVFVLSSYTRIKAGDLDWALLAEIDVKEVMIPVHKFRDSSILICGVISIGLFFLIYIVAKRISEPLLKLRTAADEIKSGRYGFTMPVYSDDEIGQLTEAFNSMSIQINAQTQALREQKRRLEHFHQATRDGIILHDNGKPLLINQAMATMTGLSIDELMSMPLHDIYAVNETLRFQDAAKGLIYETKAYRKDRSFFPVEVQVYPIQYEGITVAGSVIRDITERISAHEALRLEQKKGLSSFIDGQEDERQRLSREMHDGLGQALIGIKMRLESLHFDEADQQGTLVQVVKNMVYQVIDEVRRMSNNLMPAVLSNFGLNTALSNLCSQIQQNTGIEIRLNTQDAPRKYDDKVQMYLFRIVQEALNNAVKHSKASEIDVLIFKEDRHLIAIIEDNGKGVDLDALPKSGNGLFNMRERASLVGGTLNFSSYPDSGFVITIKIPLISADYEQGKSHAD